MTYTSREVYEYISRQTHDPIVEWKTCRIAGVKFAIYASDMEFYTKISPIFDGMKCQIPTPTLCPEERQRRRLSFRNERKLYKRKCDATGKDIISIYSPDKPYTVYDQKYRRSDARDPMTYGRDFDFTKTFTEQFGELIQVVPRPNLQTIASDNCEYTNYTYFSDTSYYLFGAAYNKDCLYGDQIANCTNCVDCMVAESCNNCYDCVSCSNSTNLYHSVSSKNCSFSSNLRNCEACSFCIDCDNLTNQKYCIQNKQVSPETFQLYIQKKHIYPHIQL
jgi:hypothetical protein